MPGEDINIVNFQASQENHRFYIAFLMISGFMAILGLSVVLKYSSPEVLAGVFGGWIAAIIGFYFMQQNVDAANQKTAETITRTNREIENSKIGIVEMKEKISQIIELDAKMGHDRVAQNFQQEEISRKMGELRNKAEELLRRMP